MKLRIHKNELARHGRLAAAALVQAVPEHELQAALARAESLILPPLDQIAADSDGFVDAAQIAFLARVFEAQSEALHAAAFVAFCRNKENN